MTQLKTVKAKSIPKSFTSQIMAIGIGHAMVIPTKKRMTAMAIIRYYRIKKGHADLKFSTKKKDKHNVYLIREK